MKNKLILISEAIAKLVKRTCIFISCVIKNIAEEGSSLLSISICYSACVSSGAAEIDVATLTNYQGLGIAKKLVTQFVRYCIEHDLVPNWDCFSTNTASLSTATSLGFEEVFHYSFLSIFKTDIKA